MRRRCCARLWTRTAGGGRRRPVPFRIAWPGITEGGGGGGGGGAAVVGGLGDCRKGAGGQRLGAWPGGGLGGLFTASERASAIAMVAPLEESAPLPERGGPAELALLDHI